MSHNSSTKYYQRKTTKKVRKIYQNLFKEEKEKKAAMWSWRLINRQRSPDNEKQKLVEFRKKYHRMRKNAKL